LIAAFRQLPNSDIALRIYGKGEEETALRNLAGRDTRIEFKGFGPEPTAAYASVDAVIVPSRWEAYGLVAIEALSAGRPVLCANVDGLCDHTEHGAVAVPLISADDLATGMNKLSQGTPDGDGIRQSGGILEEHFQSKWHDLISNMTTTSRQVL